MIELFLLSILLLSVLFYVFFNKRYAYWKIRGVPFPQPTLFFGNTGAAITLRSTFTEIFHNFYNNYEGYTYVGFFNLWKPALLIRDPEIIKDVLVKEFNSFHDNWVEADFDVDPVFAHNLFVLRGKQWKTIRTQLTPQFTSAKIKSMFPLIQKGCENMIEFINIKKESESNSLQVKDLCSRFTGDNVFNCAYGLDGKSFTTEYPLPIKIGEQISSSSKLVQWKQTIALFSSKIRKLFKITVLGDPVPRIYWDIILDAIKYREDNNVVRKDYLDFLKELKIKTSACDDVLVGYAFNFFLDGFETSALTFIYALFELSLQPDIQNIARNEIQTILKKYSGKLTYEALHEMEYVENIVFETLRKHPIIQFMSRICTQKILFPPPRRGTGKNVLIEKGTQIFIPVMEIHKDPEIYPDPEKFDPNRFSEKAKNSRPKCSFLAFGDGPRICIGRRFTVEQLTMGLVAILSKFKLELNKKTKLPLIKEPLHVFNAPKTDIWINFSPY